MGITIEVKVIAVAGSLRMTIPAPVARKLQIRAGDTMVVDLEKSTILVSKKES